MPSKADPDWDEPRHDPSGTLTVSVLLDARLSPADVPAPVRVDEPPIVIEFVAQPDVKGARVAAVLVCP